MQVGSHKDRYFVDIGKMAKATAGHVCDPATPGKPNSLVAGFDKPYFNDEGMRVRLYGSHNEPALIRWYI